jgi:hypothetical protein
VPNAAPQIACQCWNGDKSTEYRSDPIIRCESPDIDMKILGTKMKSESHKVGSAAIGSAAPVVTLKLLVGWQMHPTSSPLPVAVTVGSPELPVEALTEERRVEKRMEVPTMISSPYFSH